MSAACVYVRFFELDCPTRVIIGAYPVPGDLDAWLRDLDEGDRQLAVAAIVTEDMRAAVLRQCDFHCSAGIAHNKVTFRLQPHARSFVIGLAD